MKVRHISQTECDIAAIQMAEAICHFYLNKGSLIPATIALHAVSPEAIPVAYLVKEALRDRNEAPVMIAGEPQGADFFLATALENGRVRNRLNRLKKRFPVTPFLDMFSFIACAEGDMEVVFPWRERK